VERGEIRDESAHGFTAFQSDRDPALQLSHLCQPWPPRQGVIQQGGHPDLAHLQASCVPIDRLLVLEGGLRITEGRLPLCRAGRLVFLHRHEGSALPIHARLRTGTLS